MAQIEITIRAEGAGDLHATLLKLLAGAGQTTHGSSASGLPEVTLAAGGAPVPTEIAAGKDEAKRTVRKAKETPAEPQADAPVPETAQANISTGEERIDPAQAALAEKEAAERAAASATATSEGPKVYDYDTEVMPVVLRAGQAKGRDWILALIAKHGGVAKASEVPAENMTAFLAEATAAAG